MTGICWKQNYKTSQEACENTGAWLRAGPHTSSRARADTYLDASTPSLAQHEIEPSLLDTINHCDTHNVFHDGVDLDFALEKLQPAQTGNLSSTGISLQPPVLESRDTRDALVSVPGVVAAGTNGPSPQLAPFDEDSLGMPVACCNGLPPITPPPGAVTSRAA